MSDSRAATFVRRSEGELQPDPLGRARLRKLAREVTRGAYTLHETALPPGLGAPPHVHQEHEEAFYVLDGELAFTVAGAEPIVAAAGDVVLVPRGVEHAFEIVGRRPARYLCIFSPPVTPEERRSLAAQAAHAQEGRP